MKSPIKIDLKDFNCCWWTRKRHMMTVSDLNAINELVGHVKTEEAGLETIGHQCV
jgi:hypothetical protein